MLLYVLVLSAIEIYYVTSSQLEVKIKMIDISEVAKQSGLPASTLRYYEERGLIQSIGRYGLKRTFDSAVIERLALIALGRAAGFSLDEIKSMFTKNSGIEIDRDQLRAKAEELNRMIKNLKMIRDGLIHTADCPAPSHLECPNFKRVLSAAGRGVIPPLISNKPQSRKKH